MGQVFKLTLFYYFCRPVLPETRYFPGDVAQLVEQRTENPCVGGSIPSVTTNPDEAFASQDFHFMDVFYVYILQSQRNDSFYKGSTNDLIRRFQEHNDGKEVSTSRYLPWNLVWHCVKRSRSEAFVLEKKIKNLSIKRTIEFISKYPVEKILGGPDVSLPRQPGC